MAAEFLITVIQYDGRVGGPVPLSVKVKNLGPAALPASFLLLKDNGYWSANAVPVAEIPPFGAVEVKLTMETKPCKGAEDLHRCVRSVGKRVYPSAFQNDW